MRWENIGITKRVDQNQSAHKHVQHKLLKISTLTLLLAIPAEYEITSDKNVYLNTTNEVYLEFIKHGFKEVCCITMSHTLTSTGLRQNLGGENYNEFSKHAIITARHVLHWKVVNRTEKDVRSLHGTPFSRFI